jgi:hypothetical protein
MLNETVLLPSVTYILLVADFFADGLARHPTTTRDAPEKTPSPWSPPTPRPRRG